MADSDSSITLNVARVELARDIIRELVTIMPERSLSFILSPEGFEAMVETIRLADWGIGKNKSKLKESALENLQSITVLPAGKPVNINFTEYELKALGEVLAVIERALENHKEGILTR